MGNAIGIPHAGTIAIKPPGSSLALPPSNDFNRAGSMCTPRADQDGWDWFQSHEQKPSEGLAGTTQNSPPVFQAKISSSSISVTAPPARGAGPEGEQEQGAEGKGSEAISQRISSWTIFILSMAELVLGESRGSAAGLCSVALAAALQGDSSYFHGAFQTANGAGGLLGSC